MGLLLRKAFLFALMAITIYLTLFAILFYVRTYQKVPIIFRTTQGNTYRGGHSYVAFRGFNPNKKYDIIVLGSSHAYRGYDPAIFKEYNYDMYNLGTNSQISMVSLYIAREFIRKENCKTVIMDIYDPVFKRESLESVSDYIQNSLSDKKAVEISVSKKDVRTLNMLTMRMFNNFNGIFNPDTAGIKNGYKPYKTQLKITDKPSERLYPADANAFDYFEKLIKHLRSEGINIIVAEHPLPALFSIEKEKHAELLAKINPILKKYNVPFYDHLYDSTMTDVKYFSNPNHLSVSGVNIYNHTLLKELIRDGRLPR